MVVRILEEQRCMKRRWNWRNIFKRLQVLRYTWSRIRFGLMGVMIESRRAMQLIYVGYYDGVCLGESGWSISTSSTSLYRFGVRQYFRFFPSRTILILIVRALLLTSCTHDSMNELDVLVNLKNQSDLPLLWTSFKLWFWISARSDIPDPESLTTTYRKVLSGRHVFFL